MTKCGLALVSLFLLACGQEPAPVGPSGPDLDWTNNADNGNLRISRYGTEFAISWTDPRNGLTAYHTTLPSDVGGPDIDPSCEAPEAFALAVQDVGLPDFNDF